ncbi:hypothetical protein DEA98_27885 [Brucella pseudogrignonensis]|nr:hypothetical protein [Brucella pseudogrignonensis]
MAPFLPDKQGRSRAEILEFAGSEPRVHIQPLQDPLSTLPGDYRHGNILVHTDATTTTFSQRLEWPPSSSLDMPEIASDPIDVNGDACQTHAD